MSNQEKTKLVKEFQIEEKDETRIPSINVWQEAVNREVDPDLAKLLKDILYKTIKKGLVTAIKNGFSVYDDCIMNKKLKQEPAYKFEPMLKEFRNEITTEMIRNGYFVSSNRVYFSTSGTLFYEFVWSIKENIPRKEDQTEVVSSVEEWKEIIKQKEENEKRQVETRENLFQQKLIDEKNRIMALIHKNVILELKHGGSKFYHKYPIQLYDPVGRTYEEIKNIYVETFGDISAIIVAEMESKGYTFSENNCVIDVDVEKFDNTVSVELNWAI